jgi:hypothetical protein
MRIYHYAAMVNMDPAKNKNGRVKQPPKRVKKGATSLLILAALVLFLLFLGFLGTGCGHLKPATDFTWESPAYFVDDAGNVRAVLDAQGRPIMERVRWHNRKDLNLAADLERKTIILENQASPVINAAGYHFNNYIRSYGDTGEQWMNAFSQGVAAGLATYGAMPVHQIRADRDVELAAIKSEIEKIKAMQPQHSPTE